MTFKPYPAYKHSGVEWLGEVPENWIVCRSKNIFAERNVKAAESDEQLTASQKYGVIPQKLFSELEGMKVMQVILGRDILKKAEVNDFVISMRSFQGGLEYCGFSGAVSSAYVPVYPKQYINKNYFKYLFKSKEFISALQLTSNLVRDGQALRYNNFIQLSLPVPPIVEQEKIGMFIDFETARIDALIAEQQRLIELLKEKRQAMISHAVTKGLNPKVAMKDSGVEWLGEVPSHWNSGKIRWYLQTTSGGTPPTTDRSAYYDGDIPWLRSLDLNDSIISGYEVSVTPKALEETSCRMAPENSVLIAMYGGDGTIGKNGLLKFSSAINQAICAFLPDKLFRPIFLLRYIQFYRPYWMIGAESSRKDANISQERIGDHFVVIPPIDEQEAIINYLENEIMKIDELSAQVDKLVDLLQERRSALISAAVTGKIDVRDWQPPVDAGQELAGAVQGR